MCQVANPLEITFVVAMPHFWFERQLFDSHILEFLSGRRDTAVGIIVVLWSISRLTGEIPMTTVKVFINPVKIILKLRAMDIGLIGGIAEAHAGTHSLSYIRRVSYIDL